MFSKSLIIFMFVLWLVAVRFALPTIFDGHPFNFEKFLMIMITLAGLGSIIIVTHCRVKSNKKDI